MKRVINNSRLPGHNPQSRRRMNRINLKNVVRKIVAIRKKEKCGGNEKAFLGTVNKESFEVWTNCHRYREQRKRLGNFC